jgi:hypothetical protein
MADTAREESLWACRQDRELLLCSTISNTSSSMNRTHPIEDH